eukprot:scaffold2835_cov374-Prasinococcus_capsulatus_cf.AAC.3
MTGMTHCTCSCRGSFRCTIDILGVTKSAIPRHVHGLMGMAYAGRPTGGAPLRFRTAYAWASSTPGRPPSFQGGQ